MVNFLSQTYTIALPIMLTAFMGYIVWLLKRQKNDRDANSRGTMLLLRVQLIEYHDKYMRIRIFKRCTRRTTNLAAMAW